MPYGIVYKITNVFNGLVYIGKTCQNLRLRWRVHIRDGRHKKLRGKSLSAFHGAIQEFGEHAFSVTLLTTADNKQELDYVERHWIAQLNSTDPGRGYNRTTGGQGGLHSEEAKSHMGRRWTPEQRTALTAFLTGRKKSRDHAEKCRENFRKANLPEAKAKREAARQATYAARSPERRAEIATIQAALWTPERRQQRGIERKLWYKENPNARRRGWTPEARQEKGKCIEAWWAAHPEAKEVFAKQVREIHAKVHLGAKRSDKARENMSKAQQRRYGKAV